MLKHLHEALQRDGPYPNASWPAALHVLVLRDSIRPVGKQGPPLQEKSLLKAILKNDVRSKARFR